MAVKIRNVELLTLGRSDAPTPVLGHVGIGIDAVQVQDFELALSRVNSLPQFHLALNVEGVTTNTSNYGGIAFTQGASADTVLASIKGVNTSVDGYIDLSFNTKTVSNALYIRADGNIGIGTGSAVNAKLHVKGSSVTSDHDCAIRIVDADGVSGSIIPNLQFWSSSQQLYQIRANDAFGLTFRNSSDATKVTFDDDGNIGVGINENISSKLHVEGGRIKIRESSSFSGFDIAHESGGHTYLINYDNTYMAFMLGGSAITNQIMRLQDGNVGIGTGSNTPAQKLDVHGVIRCGRGDADKKLQFIRTGGNTFSFEHDTSSFYLYNEDTTTELLTVLNGGNVGIGTGATGPDHPLTIHGDGGNTYIKNLVKSNHQVGIELNRTETPTPDPSYNTNWIQYIPASSTDLRFYNGGDRVTLAADGKVGIGTGSSRPSRALHVVTPEGYINLERQEVTAGFGTGVSFSLGNIDTSTNPDTNVLTANHEYAYIGGGIEDATKDSEDGFLSLLVSEGGALGEKLRIKSDGKVGIGYAGAAASITEALTVNGNIKANSILLTSNSITVGTSDQISSLEEWAANTSGYAIGKRVYNDDYIVYEITASDGTSGTTTPTHTTLNQEVAHGGVTYKCLGVASSQNAGDINKLTKTFDGSAAISFDSELLKHLPTDLRNTTKYNELDESSNTAVKIVGNSAKIPALKINEQGVIIGFEEVTASGGIGGAFAGFDITPHDELFFQYNSTTKVYSDQTTKTISASNDAFDLYFNSEGLFEELKISTATNQVGDLEIKVGGTTKYLTLPDTAFTQLALGTGNTASTLYVTVGGTPLDVDLGSLVLTNATNSAHVYITDNENTNENNQITFVEDAAGGSANRGLEADGDFTYNPSTSTVTAAIFSGALSGNATTSSGLLEGSTTYNTSTSATAANSILVRGAADTYNVNIKQLTLTSATTTTNTNVLMGKVSNSDILYEFSKTQIKTWLGGLSNVSPVNGVYPITVSSASYATTAGSVSHATTATTANNVKLTSASNSVNYRLIFTSAADGASTSTSLYRDSGAHLYYNPSTNKLTATGGFIGSLTGTIITASQTNITAVGTLGSLGVSGTVTAAKFVASGSTATINEMGRLKLMHTTNNQPALLVKEITPFGSTFNKSRGGVTRPFVTDSRCGNFDTTNPSSEVGGWDHVDVNRIHWVGAESWSDERWKSNIEPMKIGLDFVRLIEPISFFWNEKMNKGTPRKNFGLRSQNVKATMEELGEGDAGTTSILGYHEKTEKEREEAPMFYDVMHVQNIMLNAIKQLDAKVQELEKEVERLSEK